jgi:hypothetical protein
VFDDETVTIAANTTQANATRTRFKLSKGILHRFEIEFPAGCAGLAHCQVYYEEGQLYPLNDSADFASDDHAIVIDDEFVMKRAPFELVLVCWNLDDTYSHTLKFRAGWLTGETSLLILKVLKAATKFFKMVGIR